MSISFTAVLPHRGVLCLRGEDRLSFLNGLVSNSIPPADQDQAVWTAFLTPQGKVIADLFVVSHEDALLVECDQAMLEDLRTRFSRYRLRAKVTLEVLADWGVAVTSGLPLDQGMVSPWETGVAFADPRHRQGGVRLLAARATLMAALETTDAAAWEQHRISLGLPDGGRDIPPETGFAMEYGFDELHGIDFRKGCFIGQETTARMKWKSLTRKRLLPVRWAGPAVPAGTAILNADGVAVGELRSVIDAGGHCLALALLKLDAATGGNVLTAATGGSALTVDGQPLTVTLPDWVRLPDRG